MAHKKEKEKEPLKGRITSTGAQVFGSPESAKKMHTSVNKDIQRYINGEMTRAQFKKKYGQSVGIVQNMVYHLENEIRRPTYKHKEAKESVDEYSQHLTKELKKLKSKQKSKGRAEGGVINKRVGPQDYRKGGLTLNTVDNRKKK